MIGEGGNKEKAGKGGMGMVKGRGRERKEDRNTGVPSWIKPAQTQKAHQHSRRACGTRPPATTPRGRKREREGKEGENGRRERWGEGGSDGNARIRTREARMVSTNVAPTGLQRISDTQRDVGKNVGSGNAAIGHGTTAARGRGWRVEREEEDGCGGDAENANGAANARAASYEHRRLQRYHYEREGYERERQEEGSSQRGCVKGREGGESGEGMYVWHGRQRAGVSAAPLDWIGGDDVGAGAFAACFFGDGLAHAVVGEAPACIGQVAWMPVVSRVVVVEAEYDGVGGKAVQQQQLFLPSSSSESQRNKKPLAFHRKPAARTQAASTRKMREATFLDVEGLSWESSTTRTELRGKLAGKKMAEKRGERSFD
ncbi:hypothetical protein B0H16DRAFT_1473002 [Mycena metata]|uniref:Uncharacterized protein n=1 Tax=Mycena metata TaxID=1033252 RepID=A0AAD7HLP5_9AGAR|nr:hypothetical protein B0H16DRAFT_1473002 [Mycena metata]